MILITLSVLVFYIFTFISEFLLGFYWISFIALGSYAVIFFIIFKLRKRLYNSSLVYLLYLIFVCSEYICLVYLGICAYPFVFLADISSLSAAFFFLSIYSSIKKDKYGFKTAVFIALVSFVISMAIFGIFTETTDMILMIIFGLLELIYLYLTISKLDTMENKIEGDSLKIGLYCQLVLLKYKVKWLFFIVFLIIDKCKDATVNKKPEQAPKGP
mmetsp:Transcript_33362/g.6037  ORF Transcript_33362/g.6037 Transcript_33362/m.6037 type:complete len:215 (+) Transcript_33362:256-900(+)